MRHAILHVHIRLFSSQASGGKQRLTKLEIGSPSRLLNPYTAAGTPNNRHPGHQNRLGTDASMVLDEHPQTEPPSRILTIIPQDTLTSVFSRTLPKDWFDST